VQFPGLIAATRLARDKKLRMVVVESGFKKIDPSVSVLNVVDNPSAKLSRISRFGGLRGREPGRAKRLSKSQVDGRPEKSWILQVEELRF
jgi:hypothetical protein